MSLIRRTKNYFLKCKEANVCIEGRSVASGSYRIGRYSSQGRAERREGGRGMCEVGWTDSWIERGVKVNIGQKMWKIFTKEVLAC